MNKKNDSDIKVPIKEFLENLTDTKIESEYHKSKKYVVIRNNKRVSDVEYDSPNDPKAIEEAMYWKKILSKWPDGTNIEISEYDNKKHRIW